MDKPCFFLWGWASCPATPDKLMTRDRASKLLRSWRRSKTQGHKDFLLKRVGKGYYVVKAMGETGTLIIRQANPDAI